MAEPGPEPGRAWRLLALCGAAVFLAAAAAGGALVAWNLAASTARGPRCPEPGVNATAPPQDLAPEVEELRHQLAEAARRGEALAGQLDRAARSRRELEEALRACEGRQNRLQTQLKTLKIEMDEAKAQGTQMGVENGALTEALTRWEAVATESAQRLDEAQRRAGAAEAEGEACAAREVALRERVYALEAELGPQRRGSRPRPRSGSRSRPSPRSRSRSGPTKVCRRPPRLTEGAGIPGGGHHARLRPHLQTRSRKAETGSREARPAWTSPSSRLSLPSAGIPGVAQADLLHDTSV